VPVSISIDRVAQFGDSFGIPLIIGEWTEAEAARARSITSLEDLPSGINATDTPYLYACFTNIFGQESKTGKSMGPVKLGYKGAAETWAEAYALIKAEDEEFYVVIPGIHIDDTVADITELVALQAVINTEPRLAVYTTDDADTKGADAGSDSLAAQMFDAGYDSAVVYSEDDDNNAGACWMGAVLPDFLAGTNPCYYPLAGVVADTLTPTEIGHIQDKKTNRVERVGGYTLVPGVSLVDAEGGQFGGVTSSGQFIDLVAAKHYLEQKISENLFMLFINNTKIPFTAAGSELVKSTIVNAIVEHGVEKNIVEAGSIVVTMPDLETYSSTKKGQRWLDGVSGNAALQGAVNKISIELKLVA
jgi:hypothetical protein